jgi:hypothetical protein
MNIYAHKCGVINVFVALFVRFMRAINFILLAMSHIDHKDDSTLIFKSNGEILESYVPIDVSNLVNFLNSIQNLQSNKETGMNTKPIIA